MTAWGATILDADGLRLTPDEKRFFAQAQPLGFILFARNIDTPDQVRGLCDEMRSAVGRDAFITVDQEGGRVQRLRGPTWREWAPPLDTVERVGAAHAPRAMYLMYRVIAAELHAVGIDSNCAPTLDLVGEDTHPFLRNRCYGSAPEAVASIGHSVAQGLLDGGVLPVMKHMPGHGRASIDTHFSLPQISAPYEDLRDSDFAPFRALSDVPMGMTAHLVFDQIDDLPATQSPRMIDLIRTDIGFDNLLMTDDLSMEALSDAPGARARAALDAGCDVALYCNSDLDTRRAVADAAGLLSEKARARVERALNARKTPGDVDISALERELASLLGEAADG